MYITLTVSWKSNKNIIVKNSITTDVFPSYYKRRTHTWRYVFYSKSIKRARNGKAATCNYVVGIKEQWSDLSFRHNVTAVAYSNGKATWKGTTTMYIPVYTIIGNI